MSNGSKLSAYFYFADTPRRRAALHCEPGSAERYALYGLDQLRARGISVGHNLERTGPLPSGALRLEAAVNRISERVGGTGGDFASALLDLRAANAADVVVATIDRLGVPLVVLKRLGLLRSPLVYVSVGLVERLRRMRRPRVRNAYLEAVRRADAIVTYSEHEARALRDLIGAGERSPPVRFVPFGVDASFFHPENAPSRTDVITIGADPQRDLPLLLRVAASRPTLRFRLVTAAELGRTLGSVPANVEVETDIPFAEMRERLASARVVALPVRNNSYSGATTVLLQALAMAKPVVVTRTDAIATGYWLEDGFNCRLVPAEDGDAFARALDQLLDDPVAAGALGDAARRTVEQHLSWDAYVDAMHEVVLAACRG